MCRHSDNEMNLSQRDRNLRFSVEEIWKDHAMRDDLFSRRQVLAGGVAGATALTMAKVGHVRSTGADSVKRAAMVKPAGTGTLADVKHVVFLMQENRSFDHYYGTMAGVKGFDDTENRAAFTQNWPGGSQPDVVALPHEHQDRGRRVHL